jgi:hypothetical protein
LATDGQRRPSLAKALEVAGIVEDAVLPASKRDSNPLEGERPYGGVVAYAALALLLIVSPSVDAGIKRQQFRRFDATSDDPGQ